MSSFCAFVGGGVAELSFVGSTDTDTTGGTLTPHGSAQAGDIAVLMSYANLSVTFATPSGWTNVVNDLFPGAMGGKIAYKILTSGDLSTGVTGISGGTVQRQIMFVFRPDDDIDAVAIGSLTSFADLSDPPNQTVTASGQQTPLVVIGFNGSTVTTTDDMASSPGFDLLVEATNAARAGYKIYNTSPSNHTISATGTPGASGRVLQSFYIRVS